MIRFNAKNFAAVALLGLASVAAQANGSSTVLDVAKEKGNFSTLAKALARVLKLPFSLATSRTVDEPLAWAATDARPKRATAAKFLALKRIMAVLRWLLCGVPAFLRTLCFDEKKDDRSVGICQASVQVNAIHEMNKS